MQMISKKSLTPQQLAAFAAICISSPVALAVFMLYPEYWVSIIFFAILFTATYILILYILQKFIYRKIKLIYKLISQTKATKREEFYYSNLLPQKGIDEVNADVEQWAEQYKTEVELLRKNEAFRKEFLQNLSHELKTPIFAIQGYVETLLNGAMNDETVNTRFLQNTSHNIDRLVSLVDDLDEISKLESGDQQLHLQNFIIQDLVKEVYDSLFIRTQEKDIKTIIKKGCEVPLAVHADKEKIRQVLINIIDNAIKYGKQGGLVEASVYKIEDKNILIEISDDGAGIPAEHLSRIFERFYRTDLARSRKEGGSGLGLSICKHIIEAHGQAIHVRSKIDVGSTFGFTLPARG